MRKTAAAFILVLALAGCAQINKPITPDDPWRDQAAALDNSLFY
ncbi:hypothetical protein [Aureimonas mangrovi]|nr:hypothetical protein [Aureimonas mangrovi]